MRSSARAHFILLALSVACGSSGSPPSSSTIPTPCDSSSGAAGSATSVALGHITVGTTVAFNVPANTGSITIIERSTGNAPATITVTQSGSPSSFDNIAVPLKVMDPGGTVIYDDTVDTTSFSPAQITSLTEFFASDSPGTGTLTIPNSTGGLGLLAPSHGLATGTWHAQISDFGYECAALAQPPGVTCSGGSTGSTYDVTIVTKPLAADGCVPGMGKIDFVVYFAVTSAPKTGSAPVPLLAATAGSNPALARMQQALTILLGNAGITVNSVTYQDLPQQVQTQFANGIDIDQNGPSSDLGQLFMNATDGTKMNVFLVSTFFSPSGAIPNGETVVGLDGTIPGPSTVGGTSASGVSVSVADLENGRDCSGTPPQISTCGADDTAYYIAHETGHFFGLYHVTEATGEAFDPLANTPMCECHACNLTRETCSPSGTGHQMDAAECIPKSAGGSATNSTCGGGDNLMFWLLEPGLSQGTLFDEQKRVMLVNPLVQ